MLSKRERELLAAMEAALMARDPRWTKQFTDSQPGLQGWRSSKVRLAFLLALGLVAIGVLSTDPVVDAIVITVLITASVAVVLVMARRDARADSPAS